MAENAVPETVQEEGDSNVEEKSLREQGEDAQVDNLIARGRTGIVTCACAIKARGHRVNYRSLLFEVVSSGRHLIRFTRSGHLCNVNDISEDILGDAAMDRSVRILIGSGCVGLLECASSLIDRGIPVTTDTLYHELWVSGRLQQNSAINVDVPLQ